MPVINADSTKQRVYPSSFGPGTIANTDELNAVYVGTSSQLSSLSDQIPPLGSITLDGSYDYYASTLDQGKQVQLQIMPGVTSWSPSPAQVAEQISLKGFQVNISAAAFVITPSGDSTGAKDTLALTSALALYGAIALAPGTFYLSGTITVANCQVSGAGLQTIIQPGSLFAGGELINVQSGGSVYNVYGYGGSTTTALNPAGDFIAIAAGQTRWTISDVDCDHMNGLVIGVAASTGMHGRIRGIRGEHNAAGIGIASAAGTVTAEINISDIDLQNCETGNAYSLFAVTDVALHMINASVTGTSAADVVAIEGPCQTCQLIGIDVGGGTGAAVHLAKGGGTGAPTDLVIIGKGQEAANGFLIEDGTARSQFMIMATRNTNDGVKSTGNGADLAFAIPVLNLNGVNDIEATSTAHIGLFGAGYLTGAPSGDNLTIPVTNNVLDDNFTPFGRTESNTPEGW